MALVTKNNMSATRTLHTLNKNASALAKDLKKVSSGMKINGAGDDASGYAISERMRVQIRGLDQANDNAQNGRSLLRVAEGSAQSTLDILRTLKEKAINAANDTNTDTDRAIIQKELDQSIDQIDDNAAITFNGKYLFDGAADVSNTTEQMIIKALNSEYLPGALDLIRSSYGLSFEAGDPGVNDMTVHFDKDGDALAFIKSWAGNDTKANKLELHVNMKYYGSMDPNNSHGKSSNPGAGYLDRTIAHEMTHAVMASVISGFSTLPFAIKEGTAELIHGIDDERMNVLLTLDAGKIRSLKNLDKGDLGYAGGYAAMRYMAQHGGRDSLKNFMEALRLGGGKALDNAIAAGSGGQFHSWEAMLDSMAAERDASKDSTEFLFRCCGIDLNDNDTGAVSSRTSVGFQNKTAEQAGDSTMSPKFAYYPTKMVTSIRGLNVAWPEFSHPDGGLKFHIGTKANQNIKVAFSHMDAEGMGLKDSDGKKISVKTQDDARYTMTVLDKSIEKALHQLTYIGSVASRLGYTSDNLVIGSENTTWAESTLRDANMAKEMTSYTKNNILLQAAQSMLAQANSSSSGVLSLLQ